MELSQNNDKYYSALVKKFCNSRLVALVVGTHIVLMSFVFVIGSTERAVLASYTIVILAYLHDQSTGAKN